MKKPAMLLHSGSSNGGATQGRSNSLYAEAWHRLVLPGEKWN
jgi:hypothetical protein